MIIPAVVAFPLVTPFAAAGLYEMSPRLQEGKNSDWSEILTVMTNQHTREMGCMAFVTLFVFWVWKYQERPWLAIIAVTMLLSLVLEFLGLLITLPILGHTT